jgi:SAM-dependent methyltransferase
VSYFETIYFRDEFGEDCYPQKLCNHIFSSIISPHFAGNSKDKVLLDVGSGRGNHLVGFSRNGLECYGLDLRPEEIDPFTIKKCDIETESFPYDSDTFDVIYSKSVIEHVYNADNFMKETYRVLKPGGIAIIMCPDWVSQYKHYWDDYTHVKAWTRKSLQNCMRIHQFKDVQTELMRQLPILWKYPSMKFLADLTALFTTQSMKWKDDKEEHFNEWIRFSKEKMLLATGSK